MQKTVNKKSFTLSSPKPVPRTIILRASSGNWLGCIYLSAFDLTGQILMYIKTKSSSLPPELSRIPVWIFFNPDKTEIENQMTNTINNLLKTKSL